MNYLDPTLYGIVSDEQPLGPSEKILEIKGFMAWAIHNQGDVDVRVGNGILIPAGSYYSDCGVCCLPFADNKEYKFTATTGNRKILLVRTKVVQLPVACAIPKM